MQHLYRLMVGKIIIEIGARKTMPFETKGERASEVTQWVKVLVAKTNSLSPESMWWKERDLWSPHVHGRCMHAHTSTSM